MCDSKLCPTLCLDGISYEDGRWIRRRTSCRPSPFKWGWAKNRLITRAVCAQIGGASKRQWKFNLIITDQNGHLQASRFVSNAVNVNLFSRALRLFGCKPDWFKFGHKVADLNYNLCSYFNGVLTFSFRVFYMFLVYVNDARIPLFNSHH